MPIFESADMLRFYNQGEQNFSNDFPFLIDRIALDLTPGTAIYTIPDYVRSISRITYLGNKLDPLPARNWREAFQPGSQQGRPFWYVYNNTGQNKIRLFPTPNVTLVAPTTGLWDTSIPTSCIIEFYRVSDNDQFILPDYARDFTLKQYIGSMLYKIEGAGQNPRMAQYFDTQWNLWSGELKMLMKELHSAPRKLWIAETDAQSYFPGSPMLPIDKFGIGVETGY